jgi:hypothetical protein
MSKMAAPARRGNPAQDGRPEPRAAGPHHDLRRTAQGAAHGRGLGRRRAIAVAGGLGRRRHDGGLGQEAHGGAAQDLRERARLKTSRHGGGLASA